MTRVLFLCGKGPQRSPTAEHVFATVTDWQRDSAGLGADADIPVSSEQLEWATHVVVMEKRHLPRLRKAFPKQVRGNKVICLDVPDLYEFMQPELIALLEARANRIVWRAVSGRHVRRRSRRRCLGVGASSR